ncbi:MAG: hypothetical protein KKC01_11470 [Gammaproteobacteria bacterium]|nr:hypothetical protein [Gammaproteobacteria bacterium]
MSVIPGSTRPFARVSRAMSSLLRCTLVLAGVLACTALTAADTDPFASLQWRNIGPVNMGGRVADVEGVPGDPRIVYVGSASGGIWKSTDAGMTFAPIFDDQPVASIGDLALAPSNPDVIYAGTGEANVRNSVSIGTGVYRSNDAGASWKLLGLEQTRHISRIAVSSLDTDHVVVGALGNIYAPSEHRGVYVSSDGGQNWQRTLYIDEYHGVADLDMDPHNPNIVFAAMWRFERKPWTHRTGSEDGGIFKSSDGGMTWQRISKGLPELMGRVAVKIAPSNPQVVYVLAESDAGTLFRSDDRGASFVKISDEKSIVARGLYYTDLRVDPLDADKVYAVASLLQQSIDGGKTWQRLASKVHIDFHSLWLDPLNPQRMWVGEDGGVAFSHDGGEHWTAPRTLPLAQFYQIFVDDGAGPFYRTGGGLQDNGTWIGPAATRERAGIYTDDWHMFSFGDAYWVVPHPEDDNVFISEAQGGAIYKTNLASRQQLDINPQTERNDGGPVEALEYRFNWNAPIIQSPHDPMTVYFGSNVVFKSSDFGDSWQQISPDLTTNDPAKQGEAGGPAWYENTVAEWHTTLISLAESPHSAGLLWAGSDDGLLHVSRNAGDEWKQVARPSGVPEFSPVSHVEPSRAAAERIYVSYDRHMFDDNRPHIFRSDNLGQRWQRITDGLPDNAWVWVVREDPRNPDVLYAGTEFGLFVSHDRGDSWQELDLGNLPTVAVHDIVLHPRRNDLLIGTHGRAIWVLDDATPIQQYRADNDEPRLYPPRTAWRHARSFTRYGISDARWVADNPPYGAIIDYHLAEVPADSAEQDTDVQEKDWLRLEIVAADGTVIRTIKDVPAKVGNNRVSWDLRMDPPTYRSDEQEPALFGGPTEGAEVLPGSYTVRLTVNDQVLQQPIEVRVDPALKAGMDGLQAEFAAVNEINGMLSQLNRRLRLLDGIKLQFDHRREELKQLGVELTEADQQQLDDFAAALKQQFALLTRDADKPRWAAGPELVEHLESLSGELGSRFQAPAPQQLAFLQSLQNQHQTASEQLDRFFSERLDNINSELENLGVAPLSKTLAAAQ